MFERLSSSQEINYLLQCCLFLKLQILGAQRVDGGNSFHTSINNQIIAF